MKKRLSQSRSESIKIISNNERISAHFESQIRNLYLRQLQRKWNHYKSMFNDERINESHHHLQNSRKFKSWFRSSIHRNDFWRFNQHDAFERKVLLRSSEQNQIRKYFQSKILKHIERSKYAILKRLHYERM